MNKRAIKIILLICLIAIPTCVLVRYDGDYKGKIIDAETKEPIEGVVVLGVWYEGHPGPGGGSHKFYEARETVTDKEGNFTIKGLGLVWKLIEPMGVIIFKSGYQYIGYGTWNSLKVDGGLLEKKVEWKGGRAIIPLKKLTMEERRKRHVGKGSGSIPDSKRRMLIKELNIEKKELGLPLY